MKKSNNSFEPIYLQDAKRHIDWLYEKIKNSTIQQKEHIIKVNKSPLVSKIWTFLKKVF